jgi:hypothetical protein
MLDISMLLTEYFAAKQKIHDAFDYRADWREIPLDDMTDVYWWLGPYEVYWCDEQPTRETVEDNDGEYSAEIYTQRFLPRWVYPAETHTMVSADTQCDGNKFLMVFDNSKYVGTEPLADVIAKVPVNPEFNRKDK